MSTRRAFIKDISAASAAVAISSSSFAGFVSPANNVRVAVIGTGMRGQGHVDLLLRRKDTDIVAICDIDKRMLDTTKAIFTKAGKKVPPIFTGDKHSYRKMLELKNIDAIIIATPWEWHAPMILDSIKSGVKYIGTEVKNLSKFLSKNEFKALKEYLSESGNLGEYWKEGGFEND